MEDHPHPLAVDGDEEVEDVFLEAEVMEEPHPPRRQPMNMQV